MDCDFCSLSVTPTNPIPTTQPPSTGNVLAVAEVGFRQINSTFCDQCPQCLNCCQIEPEENALLESLAQRYFKTIDFSFQL